MNVSDITNDKGESRSTRRGKGTENQYKRRKSQKMSLRECGCLVHFIRKINSVRGDRKWSPVWLVRRTGGLPIPGQQMGGSGVNRRRRKAAIVSQEQLTIDMNDGKAKTIKGGETPAVNDGLVGWGGGLSKPEDAKWDQN
jgi:hypothetical protein